MIEAARGSAARIVEDGRAAATAIDRMAETWDRTGLDARRILVARKLTPLVASMMAGVGTLKVGSLSVIDGELAGGVAAKAAAMSEQVKQTTGVDLPAVIKRLGA